ncbi:MAG: tetratricopeptide repeat protein [Sandaracinaceae bacterium]|nr:tetratricopeptide repeat protein [Sandaracinaceae bacterium]
MGLLRLGVFYLQERLAVGGSADVWRAVHPPSSLAVAVKLLREPIDRQAVAREARAVASLLHPAVVRIVDQGEVRPSVARARPESLAPEQPYLVMELGEATLWARPPRPGWRALREALATLLDGLAHAHARGVVHRDLKPSNVLWVRRGARAPQLAIADFGLAQLAAAEPSGGSGTPRYMAPEQYEASGDVGAWTDLYALGVIARELAFDDEGAPRFVLPSGFDAWLDRLLEARPTHRIGTAAEARYALDALGHAPEPTDLAAVPPIWSDADVTRDAMTQPAHTLGSPAPVPQRTTATSSAPPRPAPSDRPPPPLRRPLPASWREPLELGPIHVVGAGLGLYGFRALPLVGREAERDELWRALSEVVGGAEPRALAVFLTGPAGVGKTTLAEWVARRAIEVVGAHTPRVRMREDGRPGVGLLFGAREWVGCHRERTADEVREAIRRRAPHLVDHVDADELEALTRANTIDGPEPPPPPIERVRVAITFVAKASLRRPVVVLLDELQWDEVTILFLEGVLRSRGRVLVVATISTDQGIELPERLQALWRHEAVQEIPIQPLAPAEHRRLVRELLGLSDELARRVEERTAGNPMFAVQLVGDWISRGLLSVEKGALSLPPDEEVELPDDLHVLWLRRVERLTEGSAAARLALELAAVLGPEVPIAGWRAAASSLGVPVEDDFVARVLRSHLVVASADGRELRFAHGMMRESLLRKAREGGRLPALHSAAADALRAAYAAGYEATAEPLALHLVEARRTDEALAVTVLAARQAIGAGRFTDALGLLDRVDQLGRELGLAPDDRATCETHVLRASAHNRMGHLDAAAASASKALAKIRDRWPDLEALALHELGYTDYHRGKSELALSHLSRAVEVMEALRAYEPLARCLRVRGDLAHSRGEFEAARRDFARSLEVSRAIEHRAGVASSLLGLSLPGVGDPSQAAEACAIFEELGHASGACTAINTLAEAARRAGRLDEAEELYRRAQRWAQVGGVSQHEHICGLNLALTMLAGDRFEEAFVETELGARMTDLLGQRLVQYMHEVVAVAAAVGAERYTEASEHLERALELQERVDHADRDLAWAMRRAYALARDAGRDALAQQIWELAREEHRRLGSDELLDTLEVPLA